MLPWSKYLRAPKRRVVKVMKKANALSLIYDMWHKKIVADAAEDRARVRFHILLVLRGPRPVPCVDHLPCIDT